MRVANKHQKEDFKMKIDKMLQDVVLEVNRLSEKRNYNRYIKKHPVEKMFLLLLQHQLDGFSYGRSFVLHLKHLLGENEDSISQSEFSKKMSKKLPVELFKDIYRKLLKKNKGNDSKDFAEKIRIIDSSSLGATDSMSYAKHREKKNGFKLHTVIDSEQTIESVQLKNGRSSDKKSLKWAIKPGFIHVFDRGYNDYEQFEWICQKKSFFVTRALSNISYTSLKKRKVGKHQKERGILEDQYIEVIKNRKTDERFQMRMVTFQFIDSNNESQQFSLLTNIHDARSDKIASLYRERWNIEVVFRWIKMFLKIDHWVSRSKQGIMIQIYVALCAYILIQMAYNVLKNQYKIMKDVGLLLLYEIQMMIRESKFVFKNEKSALNIS
jgi:hypothetical protein